MKKSILFIFFYAILIGLSSSLYAQNFVEIKGIILREDSLSPIYGAVIYNKTSLLGTLSNKIGNFKMRVKKGDTLIVNHIGFVSQMIVFNETENINIDEKIIFTLKIRSYELPGIDVRRFRIRQKEKPFTMRREDNITYSAGIIKFDGGYYYNLPYNYSNQYTPNLVPSYGVPIGDWQAMKREEQLRKVAEMEAADRKKKQVNFRYNKAFVQKLTGLRGNELENFMNFCKPSDEMVLRANEYELTYYVLDCYDKFRVEND
ncbi:MAG: hypothetical protein SFY32_12475 [Bacteroidota bacterium]|nr:hypothetical protein [Bacteroidota bacterium]